MPSSRIMVAVSTPWASEKLFDTLRDLAERLDAVVVVAHVTQVSEEDASEAEARARGGRTLAALTGKLKDAGVATEGVLLFADDVARAILNAAEAQKATLLVLGATGKGRMARLLAGDVPTRVARAATLPVMVFPPDWSGVI